MRILLTGAQGFTGRHFCAAASAAGHDVSPLTANLLDREAVAADVSSIRPDAVVHLAGISFVAHSDPLDFYNVNLFGTLNLLDALNRAARTPACVLIASSANVYGNCDASPIRESQSTAPVNHYAMSKLAMEHMARAHARQLPLVIARPFNYTGPGQASNFVIPKMVTHFATGAPWIELGNTNVEREFNDVRMVCEAYLRLIQHGRRGETYNICTGVAYSLSHIMEVLARLTGHSVEVRVDPSLVRPNEISRLCGSPHKLERDIGTLVAPAIEDTLAWMLANSVGR